MRFLIDAQLPLSLKTFVSQKGFEALHVLDLPLKDKTSDSVVIKVAVEKQYVVISKDSDFLNSHLLLKQPTKLLLVTTGNIVNSKLLIFFESNWEKIIALLNDYDLIELNNTELIAHEK